MATVTHGAFITLANRILAAYDTREVFTIDKMAEFLGLPPEKVRPTFNRMVGKGLVYRVGTRRKGSAYRRTEGAKIENSVAPTISPKRDVYVPQHDELHQLFFSKGDYHGRGSIEGV